jgi:hypothetical protein
VSVAPDIDGVGCYIWDGKQLAEFLQDFSPVVMNVLPDVGKRHTGADGQNANGQEAGESDNGGTSYAH